MPEGVLEVLEPATEAVLEELPRAGAAEVDAAVTRAAAAFPAWRARDAADRAAVLRSIAATVEEHREELARLEARNVGKPIGDARGEMGMVATTFRYYAGAPERLLGDTIPVAGGQALTVREPLGVVGLIVPWNFPLTIAALEARPGARRRQHGRAQARRADAADARCASRELALEAGIPEGVVNVVVGPGRDLRRAARRAPRRREDRLHRLDRGRPLDRRRRRRRRSSA